MSPKQKRAFAVLILAAMAGGLAAFAPALKCELPDESVIEDLIPDEPSSNPMSPPEQGAVDNGSSGAESSSGSSST